MSKTWGEKVVMTATLNRNILILIGALVCALVLCILLFWHLKKRRATHTKLAPPFEPTWDPALCPHLWKTIESQTCSEDYGSSEGPLGAQAWKVSRCKLCGIKRFSCTNQSCPNYDECKRRYEEGSPEPGEIRRIATGRFADAQGFEYLRYDLSDRFGNQRTGYCRVIPTTYPFTCPDCGGMVVGVDTPRVRPGGTGPEPTAFRCETCGRTEPKEFGVPRMEDREGAITYDEPRGMQPACPHGGKHNWEVIAEWESEELPEDVDGCLEDPSLVQVTRHQTLRCTKCGEEKCITASL